jgi:hypothetical protein
VLAACTVRLAEAQTDVVEDRIIRDREADSTVRGLRGDGGVNRDPTDS